MTTCIQRKSNCVKCYKDKNNVATKKKWKWKRGKKKRMTNATTTKIVAKCFDIYRPGTFGMEKAKTLSVCCHVDGLYFFGNLPKKKTSNQPARRGSMECSGNSILPLNRWKYCLPTCLADRQVVALFALGC